MPDCHKCKHNLKKHRACIKCKGPSETNHKGRSHKTLDIVNKHGDSWADAEASQAIIARNAKPVVSASPEMLEAAAFVDRLFRVDRKTYGIIRFLFLHPGTPLRSVAKRFGISTQAAHHRLKELSITWPQLKQLVGLKFERKK